LERIEAQVPQIGVYGEDVFLARACVDPGTVGAAACADFGHSDQIIRVRMQRLSNDLVACGPWKSLYRHGSPQGYSLTQHRDRTGNGAWRA